MNEKSVELLQEITKKLAEIQLANQQAFEKINLRLENIETKQKNLELSFELKTKEASESFSQIKHNQLVLGNRVNQIARGTEAIKTELDVSIDGEEPSVVKIMGKEGFLAKNRAVVTDGGEEKESKSSQNKNKKTK